MHVSSQRHNASRSASLHSEKLKAHLNVEKGIKERALQVAVEHQLELWIHLTACVVVQEQRLHQFQCFLVQTGQTSRHLRCPSKSPHHPAELATAAHWQFAERTGLAIQVAR